jgi:hypothetical protein
LASQKRSCRFLCDGAIISLCSARATRVLRVAVLQLIQRLGDMRAALMRIAFDHDHGFVAADAFDGRQVHSGLHKVRDGRVTQC